MDDHLLALIAADEEAEAATIPAAASEAVEGAFPNPEAGGAGDQTVAGNHAVEAGTIHILEWEKEEEKDYDVFKLSDSTIDKHRSIRRTEWREFNNGNVEEKPRLVTREGRNPIINLTLIRDFMAFCENRGAKECRFRMGAAFLQYYVRIQFTELELSPPKGYVLGDPKVSASLKAIQGKAADDALTNSEDALADCIFRDVTEAQTILFVKTCLSPPPGSMLQGVTFIARLNLAAIHRESLMVGQRGESIVGQRLGFCFVEQFKNIGPHKGGTPIDMSLTNKGKSNRVGRKEYTALGCHVNPILDAIGLQGIMLLWRFIGKKEYFPNGQHTEAIKARPLFVSPNNHMMNYNKNTLGKHWAKANEDCEILTQKITHQGKGQLLREFDMAQILPGPARRHGNVSANNKDGKEHTTVVEKSYMTNKPAITIVQAAGGDWHNLREHSPPWALLSEEDPHGYSPLLHALLDSEDGVPALSESEADYLQGHDETRKTHRHFVKARLKNAKGYNDAMRSRLQRGLLLAASRPLDDDGNLIASSEPIYRLFPKNNCPVFQLPIFHCSDFLQLVERVRVAQDRDSVNSEPSSS